MDILLLTQILPYPPDAGPRVKTWHVLRYLAQRGHQVTLASFMRPEEEAHLPEVEKICAGVHTVPIRRSRAADILYWLRSHTTGRPFLIERDDLGAMRSLVQKLVVQKPVDVIHADQLGMAQFALPYRRQGPAEQPIRPAYAAGSVLRKPKLVFDAHNAVWTIVERMQQTAPWFFRPPAAVEARRVKRYEGQIVRLFDHTLSVTEIDRQALLEAVGFAANGSAASGGQIPLISVVPIAVDTQKLQPVQRRPGSANLVALGTLHYPPNADGIRWFARAVFPRVRQQVPEATLTIIGKNPPPDFLQLASQTQGAIRVTGYVPDLVPFFREAALMVVPVRAGGGMRVRILEAFAQAMPVVTTTVGLEGIDAKPGEDVLVADAAEDFSREVVKLLRDREAQNLLAKNGRQLAERVYDWQVVLMKMDAVYQ